MEGTERTDSLVSKLFASLKRYLGLQREYAMLEVTEKSTRVLTVLILGAILFVIGTLTLIFLSLTLVAVLDWLFGCQALAYGLVTLVYVAVGYVVYAKRERWIVTPLMNFFANLLLKDDENGTDNNQ